eukprot:3380962-Prymnesium_polylepis.1
MRASQGRVEKFNTVIALNMDLPAGMGDRSRLARKAKQFNPRGGDEPRGPHAPCVRWGGVDGYSHLLNGDFEACLQIPRA